jgi:hypothetical protein
MIYITKNITNDLFVTLTEKVTYNNPYFLLELVNNDNLQSKVIRLAADDSTNPLRYNSFFLIEAPTDDLENAQVNLGEGMTYDYTFYETQSTSGTTIGSGENIVETGILKVKSTSSPINSTYTNQNTIITYGK